MEAEARKKKARTGIPGGITCENYPILYLNVPKSACTTIKNLLYFVDTGVQYEDPLAIHSDKQALLKSTSPDKAGFLAAIDRRKITFTFVREPFSRAYSAFNEKIYFESKYSFPGPRKLLVERYGARFPGNGQEYTDRDHAANFLKFLDLVADSIAGTAAIRLNPHWSPQSIILENHRKRVNIDVVGRVEQFAIGMQYVLDFAKVERNVDLNVRHNEGPPPPFKLQEIINDELYDKLFSVYRADVRGFGYRDSVEKYR